MRVCKCAFLSLRITRLGMRLTCLKLIWVFVLCHAGWQGGARLAPNRAREEGSGPVRRRPDATPVTVQGWAEGTQ